VTINALRWHEPEAGKLLGSVILKIQVTPFQMVHAMWLQSTTAILLYIYIHACIFYLCIYISNIKIIHNSNIFFKSQTVFVLLIKTLLPRHSPFLLVSNDNSS